MKAQKFAAMALFGCAIAVGVFVAQFSWNGVIYLSDSDFRTERSPAAIRRDLDFSLLNGAELVTASQKRLVTAARTVNDNNEIGIELGHFVTRGGDGKRELACDVYDRIMLRFEAEGIAEAGEKPVMEIESPCTTGRDITMIQAVWIPVARILREKPVDMDLSFNENESNQTSFKFANMPSEWPTQWRLQAVRLIDVDKSGPEVSIAGQELRGLLKRPLVLSWGEAVEKTHHTH